MYGDGDGDGDVDRITTDHDKRGGSVVFLCFPGGKGAELFLISTLSYASTR